jgi:hypothetical protein
MFIPGRILPGIFAQWREALGKMENPGSGWGFSDTSGGVCCEKYTVKTVENAEILWGFLTLPQRTWYACTVWKCTLPILKGALLT